MVRSYAEIRTIHPSMEGDIPSYKNIRNRASETRMYQEQLRGDMYDTIFSDGRVESFVDFKPPDDFVGPASPQERLRGMIRLIETHPEPDEYRAKLANSIDIADVFNTPYDIALRNHDELIKGLWGKDTTAVSAFERIKGAKKEGRGLVRMLRDEDWWDSAKRHTGRALTRSGMSLKKTLAGYAQISGYLNQKLTPFEVESYDKTREWGERMSKGVQDFYTQNPHFLIRDIGDGYWDTTKKYLNDPWLIYEGIIETIPMMMGAWLGHITGTTYAKYIGKGFKLLPWFGRVQGFALPLTGQRYAELRDEGIEPAAALAHAILSGQGEALLEEWTFNAKLNIFKGAGKFVQKSMATQASKFLLGGAKVYARGSTEEGSQAIWTNFLRKVFVDPDQTIMDGVFSQAAAGGLIEATMAGGFVTAGRVRYSYNINKSANEIVKNSTLSKEQAKRILDETYQELFSELQNEKLSDEVRNELFNNNLANKIDLSQRTNIIIKKAELREQVVSKEGQVARLNKIRTDVKSGDISQEDAVEVDDLIDNTIAKIEDGKDVTTEAPVSDIIEIPAENILEEIEQSPKFGIVQTTDGDWIVTDWETQKEIGKPGGKRFITNQANKFNSGELVVEPERRAPLLPSEETVTKTIRQMLNIVMKAVSRASARAYLQGARDLARSKTNLAKYANRLLSGIDITKSQRRTLMNAIAKPRTPAQQVAALATVQRLADKAIHTQALKELRKTMAYINRQAGRVMQEGGLRPEYLLRIQTLTNAITLKGKAAAAKFNKAVVSLRKHVEGMRESLQNQYERSFAEELLPPRLFERIGELPVKSAQDMTAEELLELNNALKTLLHLNRTKNRIILDRTARDAASVLNGAVEDMSEVKNVSNVTSDIRTPRHKRSAIRTFMNWTAGRENHDIETLVDTMSGGKFGVMFEVIPEALSYGRSVQAEYILAANDHIRNVMSANGISILDLQQMSPAFFRILRVEKTIAVRDALSDFGLKDIATPKHNITIGDTEVPFTMAELMSFYSHGQNGYNIREIIKSGIAVRAGNTMNRVKNVTTATFAQVADIIQENPKALALIDAAFFIHDNIAKPAINKVSLDLKGIELAQVSPYTHIERWSTGGVAGTEAYRISLLELEGRLQERVGGKNPIKMLDFFEVLLNDVQSISEYVGMAKPYRSIKMLLNYKPLRNVIIEKGYEPQLRSLDTLMAFTEENINATTKIDSLFGSILRGTTRAVLAMPHIMIGQYVSTGGYFLEADIKYVKVLRIAATKATEKRYLANWPFARLRKEGGLTSRVMGEIVQSDRALRAFTSSKAASNWFLGGINHVDSRAIIEAARITEAEMADKNRPGKSKEYWDRQGIEPTDIEFESEEYWEAFRKRAIYLVRRTQPMFTPEHRSVLTAGKEPTKRMFTLFRSYVDQPLRLSARLMTAYRNGKISWTAMSKGLGLVMSLFVFHSIITDIIKNLMFKEDRDLREYVLNALTSPVGALTFVGFPLEAMIQRAVEVAWGERPGVWKPRFDTVATSWINSIIDAGNDIALAIAFAASDERFQSGPDKGELKSTVYLKRGLLRGTQEALRYVGIPVQIPRKVYKGWTKENKGKFKIGEIK